MYASTGQHESAPPLGNTAPDVLDAVLHEGARFVEEVIQPLSAVGDVEGCIFRDGEVRTPPGFREADRQFVEAGWACVGAGAGSTIALDPEAF